MEYNLHYTIDNSDTRDPEDPYHIEKECPINASSDNEAINKAKAVLSEKKSVEKIIPGAYLKKVVRIPVEE